MGVGTKIRKEALEKRAKGKDVRRWNTERQKIEKLKDDRRRWPKKLVQEVTMEMKKLW